MATINGKEVKVNYNGINGIEIASPHDMKALRDAIAKYKEGIRAILDLQCYAPDELWDEAYRAYNGTICRIVDDRKHIVSRFVGDNVVRDEIDLTDVPFLRVMDDNCCIRCFHIEGYDEAL